MMMTGFQRRALLAEELEKNAANPRGMKFDLSTWFGDKENMSMAPDCGTVGCAVGLACLMPEFKKEGLTVEFGTFAMCPRYRKQSGWDAVEAFFGLNYDDSEHLFSVDAYEDGPTTGAEAELRVAKRLRKYNVDHPSS